MSAENESLQTNLSRVELDLNTRAARVNQLQVCFEGGGGDREDPNGVKQLMVCFCDLINA